MSRELDALVAEQVMEWKKYDGEFGKFWRIPGVTGFLSRDRTPDFGGDIAAAWQVVERLQEQGHSAHMWRVPTGGWKHTDWSAEFYDLRVPLKDRAYITAIHSLAPTAICIAALYAVGVPEDEIQAAVVGNG